MANKLTDRNGNPIRRKNFYVNMKNYSLYHIKDYSEDSMEADTFDPKTSETRPVIRTKNARALARLLIPIPRKKAQKKLEDLRQQASWLEERLP